MLKATIKNIYFVTLVVKPLDVTFCFSIMDFFSSLVLFKDFMIKILKGCEILKSISCVRLLIGNVSIANHSATWRADLAHTLH